MKTIKSGIKSKSKNDPVFDLCRSTVGGVNQWQFVELHAMGYNAQFSKKYKTEYQKYLKDLRWFCLKIGLEVPKNSLYGVTIEIIKEAKKGDTDNYYKPIIDILKGFGSDDKNCEYVFLKRSKAYKNELTGVRFLIQILPKNHSEEIIVRAKKSNTQRVKHNNKIK
jgi:Holliday junction resolvase RusA-like endonuclease